MTTGLDAVHTYLRERGFRNTQARREILQVVFAAHDHFTAEELLDRIKAQGGRVSRASVYRTLSILVEGGFVESREFQRGQLMYEAMLCQHHHDHLICNACHRIVEFENEQIEKLQEREAARHGFKLAHHSLRLYGLCGECREAGKSRDLSLES